MTKAGFECRSPCGRVWFVPKSAVVDDYVEFLMSADNLSETDARAKAEEVGDLDFWFYEQFDWGDAKRVGTLVKDASPEQVTEALNFLQDYVGGGPSNDCTVTGKEIK